MVVLTAEGEGEQRAAENFSDGQMPGPASCGRRSKGHGFPHQSPV